MDDNKSSMYYFFFGFDGDLLIEQPCISLVYEPLLMNGSVVLVLVMIRIFGHKVIVNCHYKVC